MENDENKDPKATTIDSGNDPSPEDEEVAVFSPAVTRTPSASRTKKLSNVEPLDYRKSHKRRISSPTLLTVINQL